jgi:mediator of RNA polymerase II transcription subunit 7
MQSEWTVDRAFHLQKITRSILLNFLELIGNMSQDATQSEPKVDDLRTLFGNAYQILNEYRPHQARETLILMMEEQIATRKDEIEAIKNMKERLDAISDALPQLETDLESQDLANITQAIPQAKESTGPDIFSELQDD